MKSKKCNIINPVFICRDEFDNKDELIRREVWRAMCSENTILYRNGNLLKDHICFLLQVYTYEKS